MKELIATAALLLSLSLSAQEVTREFDRFKQQTNIRVDLELKQTPNPYSVLPNKIIFHATKGDGPVSYSALISTNSSIGSGGAGGWRYLNVDSIDWLIDGEPADFPKVTADRRVTGRAVGEYFIQSFTRAQLEQIAAAQTVEFRIGSDEFSLSADQILAVADLSSQAADLESAASTTGP